MGIEVNAGEWAVFFFRTLHIVAAIAWIGASFYFVWLDMNLRPVSGEKLGKGLHGELWDSLQACLADGEHLGVELHPLRLRRIALRGNLVRQRDGRAPDDEGPEDE